MDGIAHRNLCEYLGLPAPDTPIIDWTMGTVEPCDEVKTRFGSDVRRVGMNVIPPRIVDDRYRDGFVRSSAAARETTRQKRAFARRWT